MSSLDGLEKDDLIEVVEGIAPGGGTNLSGGWLKAVEALLASPPGPHGLRSGACCC